VVMFGEEAADCKKFIDAHNQCLRAEGFDI